MKNPFHYGGIVGESSFCNREKEQDDLLRFIKNITTVFFYAERRIGKTSLVKRVLSKLPKEKYITAYIDLWPTDGPVSFVEETAKAVSRGLESTADKLLRESRSYFSRLSPSVTLDPAGHVQVQVNVSRSSMVKDLEQVLSSPEVIGKRRKKDVVVVFDEFQRIFEYETDLVERKLRSIIQSQTHVSYIFMGSRKHMIEKMINDQSRPLYKAGSHYHLKNIATEHWVDFVQRRFKKAQKEIPEKIIHTVCELTDGHPYYTQHFFHILWDLCDPGKRIGKSSMDEAIDTLLQDESYAYHAMWDALTLNQRRFLKALSRTPEPVQIFSTDFIRDHDLGTSSKVQRVVGSLLKKDILDRLNGSLVILDRFFKLWMKTALLGDPKA